MTDQVALLVKFMLLWVASFLLLVAFVPWRGISPLGWAGIVLLGGGVALLTVFAVPILPLPGMVIRAGDDSTQNGEGTHPLHERTGSAPPRQGILAA